MRSRGALTKSKKRVAVGGATGPTVLARGARGGAKFEWRRSNQAPKFEWLWEANAAKRRINGACAERSQGGKARRWEACGQNQRSLRGALAKFERLWEANMLTKNRVAQKEPCARLFCLLFAATVAAVKARVIVKARNFRTAAA